MTEPDAQSDPSVAEELFMAFLTRHLPNCPTDAFERMVELHPGHAPELRRLRDRWTNEVASLLGSRHSIDQFKLDQILAPPEDPVDELLSMPLDLGAADERGEAARLLERLGDRPSPQLRYRLDGQIAQGGMGIIYRIWDMDLRRYVVMKAMKPRPGEHGAPGFGSSPGSRLDEGTGADDPNGSFRSSLGSGELGSARRTAISGTNGSTHARTRSGSNGSSIRNGSSPSASGSGGPSIDEAGRRFLDEACLTAQLDHPGIVPVHELGRDETGRLFFTMKLVKGLDFKTVIDRVHAGDEGFNRAVGAVRRVAEAVAYAHSKNVIHRDIKPQNIMVGRFGETYLMDWGLARKGDELAAQPSTMDAVEEPPPSAAFDPGTEALAPDSWLFTQDGKVLGTPPYMSPEQARGEIHRVSDRSDVYSLGAILYHLLSGRIPYVDEGQPPVPFLILMRVRRGPPQSLAELAPDAPPTLLEITERAMAREPEDRYADANEMATALADYLEDISEAREEARRQAERAQLVNQFLIDMLSQANPENARGVDMTVRQLVERAAAGIDTAFPGHPVNEAVLRLTIGTIYRQLGEYEAAEAHLGRARELVVESLGDEHPDSLQVTTELALLNRLQGRLAEAEQRLQQVLSVQLASLGPDHATSVRTQHLLAGVLYLSGDRLDEAEELFGAVLAARQALLPTDHPDTLATMMALSQVLLARGGRLEETEVLLRSAVDGYLRVHGTNHPATLGVMSDLAVLLSSQGRTLEAADVARRTLEGQREVFGEDHPNVLLSHNNLGSLLRDLGELDEAERHLVRAIEGQQASLGQDHKHTLNSMHSLALLYERQRRLPEAEALFAEVVERASAALPADSVEVARFRFNHGRLLIAVDRPEDAAVQIVSALDVMLNALDPEHVWIAEARQVVAELDRSS